MKTPLLPLAAVVLSVGFLTPHPANAQQSDDQRVDLVIPTSGSGTNTATPATSTAVTHSAASKTTKAKAHTATTASKRYRRGDLSSRGDFDRADSLPRLAQTQTTITGRVGVVVADKAVLRREYDSSSRVLSKVPKGTNLALVYEAGDYYGVMMIDNSVGWVAKSSVQLIDYQVEVTPPAQSAPAPNTMGGAVDSLPGFQSSGPAPTSAQLAASALPANTSPRVVSLIQEAFSYMGVPYVWGGETRRGLDCSAFVRSVFASQGVSLPRVAADQALVGTLVDWHDLQAGDRLYFDMGNKGRVSHTGLYLGNGYFIHASTNHGHVDVDQIMKPGYYKALVCARRSL